MRYIFTITLNPSMVTHNWKGTHNPENLTKDKKLCTWHPKFLDLHRRDESPRHLALKAQSACVHKTHEAH